MATDADRLVMRDPRSLKFDPRNANKHPEEQLEMLRGLVREVGFQSAVLVDEDDVLIAGEARTRVAILEGIAEVPVLVCRGLSAQQRAMLALADNQIPRRSVYDVDVLSSTMRWLQESGVDLGSLGFDVDFVGELLGAGPSDDRDPDVQPEVPAVARSKEGDVWVCGPHRVVCGNAEVEGAYRALLGEERVDCVWTDPPYNVNYDGKAHLRGGRERKIKNDDQSVGAFSQMLGSAFRHMHGFAKAGAPIYVAHSETERAAFTLNLTQGGWKMGGVVIWRKNALVMGRADWQWIHEPILYGWKPGAKHRWYGGRKLTTVQEIDGAGFSQREDGAWAVVVNGRAFVVNGDVRIEEVEPSVLEVAKPRKADLHPTMKPVALIERMLRASARPGDLVLDPFGGSGSTLIACDRMGMSARLLELDPRYVDVIVRRWEDFTGRQAELVNGGAGGT